MDSPVQVALPLLCDSGGGGRHVDLHDDSAGAAACARSTDSPFSTDGSPPGASALGADVWGGSSVPVQLLCPIQHQVRLSDGR